MTILCISGMLEDLEFTSTDSFFGASDLFILMSDTLGINLLLVIFLNSYVILPISKNLVLACLKIHGGIDLSLILQAVKCHPLRVLDSSLQIQALHMRLNLHSPTCQMLIICFI